MLHIPIFYPELYDSLNIYAYNAQLGMQSLILVSLIAVVFRIALCIGYQNIYTAYILQSKEIPNKEDINNIKYGFFSKVVKFYVSVAEKGSMNLTAREVVERQLGRSGFLLLNFKSYKSVLETFENSVLLIGVLLALAIDEKASVAAVTVSLFAVIKILGLFFDYGALESKIILEISNYIQIEINKFYAKDTISAVNLLRIEIKNSIQAQTSGFREAINKFCTDLTATMDKSMKAMAQGVEDTMKSVTNNKDIIDEPLMKWKNAIDQAADSQQTFNKTLQALNTSVEGVGKITNIVDGGFSKMSGKMEKCFLDMSGQIEGLKQTTAALKESNSNYSMKNDEIEHQIKYVKTNQQALEASLQQYEVTLKEITTQIGEGMGRIIDYHIQDTYSRLNESLQENLSNIMKSNIELADRLQSLFAQMQEQSKSETNAIISIKEQMDMNFKMLGK